MTNLIILIEILTAAFIFFALAAYITEKGAHHDDY